MTGQRCYIFRSVTFHLSFRCFSCKTPPRLSPKNRNQMILSRGASPSKLKHLASLSPLSSQYDAVFLRSSSSLLPANPNCSIQNPNLEFPLHSFCNRIIKHFFSSKPNLNTLSKFSRDGNFDEIASQTQRICPGCGVHMQDMNPNLPGFFIKPIPKSSDHKSRVSRGFTIDETEASNSLKRGVLNELVESENPPLNPNLAEKLVVCARCHSLRHYGKVKDESVENLLPDFDFYHTIGRKLASTCGRRSVVLMVVDAVDFDGSFPKRVAKLVSATIDENVTAWKEGKSGNVPRVVLVLTKLDLLPSSISPTRLEHWVRQRAREGGANKLTSVHMVSAVRDWGLQNLIDEVIRLAGPRGNVWAIGAQNAGKSTLINAIGKRLGGNVIHLTEAPVPGTTLGIVRIEGMLPGHANLFDTPGLLHPHQLSTRLTREEQRLVHIGKELKPRTYRIKAGYTVHIAGLTRLDVEELSVDSVYITVWASPHLPLHMGRTENASWMLDDHFGRQLQPPIRENRVKELGQWVRQVFQVTGSTWDSSTVDVAVAGVGWFAIGLKGEAVLAVWTYDGLEVVVRNSLIPHRAQYFEVAGFTVSKIVSQADKISNKSKREKENNHKSGVTMPASPLSVVNEASVSC